MKDFIEELTLALRDYFCGTVVEREGKIVIELSDGDKFEISVKQI